MNDEFCSKCGSTSDVCPTSAWSDFQQLCESCLSVENETKTETQQEIAALEDFFNAPAPVVIGDGKRKETDVAVWVDPDELRYNHKMGLDKNGDPMAVDKTLQMREEEGFSMTLSEGFDILEMDGDDEFSGLAGSNDPFNESGFNQW